jgi:hypothetical protein
MIVSDEMALEFQQLFRRVYGEDISLAEAREEASHLLDLFKLFSRPLPSQIEEHKGQLREP